MYTSLLFFLFICHYSCYGRSMQKSSFWSWRRQQLWGQLSTFQCHITEPFETPTVLWRIRGGDAAADATATTETETTAETASPSDSSIGSGSSNNDKKPLQTLDQRVRAALQKFGLAPSTPPAAAIDDNEVEQEQSPNEGLDDTINNSSVEEIKDSIVESDASVTTSATESPNTELHDRDHNEDSKEEITTSVEITALETVAVAAESPSTTECEDGVCTIPPATEATTTVTATPVVNHASNVLGDEDYYSMAQNIASDMGVHASLAMAALIATRPDDDDSSQVKSKSEHVQAARALIDQELERINQISADAPEVQQLVSEGYDAFLSRRALAFAEMNMDDARAILLADQLDEEEEEAKIKEAKLAAAKDDPETALAEQPLTAVHTNFDPAQLHLAAGTNPRPASPEPQSALPKPAKRSDVVFEATAAQIQDLVLESPVPVLLDVYADWCGPCKVLGPALEEMAIKAGGVFRLVKVNTDRERVISTALEVTALPTVFGIRDGQIVHMFQGMPRSDEFIKNFMMNLLMPGYSSFDPPITPQEKKKYAESTLRLAKMAGAACWPFSARERLQDRVLTKLDELVKEAGGMAQADDSAKTIRSLLSNIVRDPYNLKFRNINLANKLLAQKVSPFRSSVAILKAIGFSQDGSNTDRLSLKPNQKVINVAPLVVARDCIDKWIDKNRYEISVAARKRKDELDRARLAEEAAAKAAAAATSGEDVEEEEITEEGTLSSDSCTLRIRLEGKKKIHEVVLDGDEPLRAVFDALPSSFKVKNGAEAQLTCAAKRLVIKSSDEEAMKKSLTEHGLLPTASFVIKIIEPTVVEDSSSFTKDTAKSRLSQRAAVKKSRKKGSHTMQSIGVYAKDDNNKAELIDGGGGVWYEHDVSDDEGESAKPATDDSTSSSTEDEKATSDDTSSEPEGDNNDEEPEESS